MEQENLNGLNKRHVKQIIRSKMTTKVIKDKTKYSRKKKHKNDNP